MYLALSGFKARSIILLWDIVNRFLHVQNFSFEPIALSLLCRLMISKFLQCLLNRTATTLFVTLFLLKRSIRCLSAVHVILHLFFNIVLFCCSCSLYGDKM